MKVVFGGRGQLGATLSAAGSPSETTVSPPRERYVDWWRNGASGEVARYLRSLSTSPGVVYVASGLTDPRATLEEHRRVNVHLTQQLVLGAWEAGWRPVTFGTIMEVLAPEQDSAYVQTKLEFADWARKALQTGQWLLHLRLHTLYGGAPPKPFMFLGQMLQSLQDREVFTMSSGRQLREYHHVEDEVRAIERLIEFGEGGIAHVTHGSPIRLIDLATGIFRRLGRIDMLRPGARQEPAADVYDQRLERPASLDGVHFRNTEEGVAAYLESWLKGDTDGR